MSAEDLEALNLEVFKILVDNTLVNPNVRISKDISSAYITSIPVNEILNKYKENDRLLRHIFMNAIILPIVKDQENLYTKENDKEKKMDTILVFAHNNQKIIMTISCYYSDQRNKNVTLLKINYEDEHKQVINIVENTQDYARFNQHFVNTQYPHILIDQYTPFSKILHNSIYTSRPFIKTFINALFTDNIQNKPKVQITTDPRLSVQFTNYIKNVKFSSTGGMSKELWDIVNPNIVNPQGGASKQTKYKKSNQIIAYKNKSYCLYTGIKGGNYIRVKHNGTFIFKYIKPT